MDPDVPRGIRLDVRGAKATIAVSYKVRVFAKQRQTESFTRPARSVVTTAIVRDASGTYPMTLVRAEDAEDALDQLMKAPPGRAQATLAVLGENESSDGMVLEAVAPKATTLTLDLTMWATNIRFSLPRGHAIHQLSY